MNKLDTQYQNLLRTILEFGVDKLDRTGTGTKSIFGYTIRHNMQDGFPLLTTKKVPFKTITTELLWFLRGDTNIKYLVDNGCNIWVGDAYKKFLAEVSARWEDGKINELYEEGYMTELRDLDAQLPNYITYVPISQEEFINKIKTDDEFAKKWGELGPVYGRQWRDWNGKYKLTEEDNNNFDKWNQNLYRKGIDQIQNLINELKTNPDSRRLMVTAWNPSDLPNTVLPPCHYGFQVYTRELSLDERLKLWDNKFGFANEEQKNQFDPNVHLDTHGIPTRAISLMWNQRSVDTFLGLPFNIASYGLLLEIIAREVNMIPDELIGNLGDTHLYLNHIEQAKEQIGRTLFDLPKLCMDYREGEYDKDLKGFVPDDFVLLNYKSHPAIKAPLSN